MIGRRLVLGCLFVTAVLGGCVGPSPDAGPAGASEEAKSGATKRLTVAVRSEPLTVSAMLNRGGGTGAVPGNTEIESLLNSPKTMVDAEGIRKAHLVEEVPTVENGLWRVGPDGRMETTWRIRNGVRWHDGAPFAAEDLVFTSKMEQDTEIAVFRTPAYDSFDSVEAVDARTLVVKWRVLYIEADRMFGSPAPKHLLEETYSASKENLTRLPYWQQDFVGVGPYKLRAWEPGSHAVLDAFDGYALGRPKIDEIVVRFIPDANTLVANLLAGEIDLTMGRGISFDQGMRLREQWPEGKVAFPSSSAVALYPQHLNPNPAVLGDVRFRRALFHGIDRQELVDTFMGGAVPISHSVVDVRDPEYRATESAILRYDYDLRKAAQLIESLGLTRGPDGFYNVAPSLEIQAVVTTEINDKAMLSVADYWRRLGVPTVTNPLTIQRQRDMEYRMARGGFDLAGGGTGWVNYHSSATPLPENSFRGRNKTRYMNAELDALIDRYFTTIPFGFRMDVLGQIVHHISDRVVVMGLFHDAQAIVMTQRLKNVTADIPSASSLVWNAHEWDLR